MQKIFIVLLFSLYLVKSSAQISFYPELASPQDKLNQLFQKKNLKGAIKYLDSIISIDSKDGKNYFNRSVIYYYSKTMTTSSIVENINKAISKRFDHPELYYLLFSQYCNCDRIRRSGNILIDDVEIDFFKALEQINLAIEKEMKEKYLLAKSDFYKSEVSNRSWEGLLKYDFYDYQTTLKNLISKSKKVTVLADANYQLAHIQFKFHKDTLRGLSFLGNAITINPKESVFYADRAYYKEAVGNFKGALLDYNSALIIDKNPYTLLTRARLYKNKINDNNKAIGDYSEVIKIYLQKRKLALNQGSSIGIFNELLGQAYSERGEAFFTINKPQQGCSDFQEALNYGGRRAQYLINEYCK